MQKSENLYSLSILTVFVYIWVIVVLIIVINNSKGIVCILFRENYFWRAMENFK